MNIPEKCPHCRRGDLKDEREKGYGWSFICSVCSRAWIVLDDKYWLAGFDAGGHVYEVTADGQVIDRNSYKDDEFRRNLWNMVRG
jgi:hypothetical protein